MDLTQGRRGEIKGNSRKIPARMMDSEVTSLVVTQMSWDKGPSVY
jgi:hypothetical protein